MKRRVLLIVLFFMMLFSRQPLRSQTQQVDSLPVYNLFYLSKYISSTNLTKQDSLKIYTSLVTLIRSSGSNISPNDETIKSFIVAQDTLRLNNIKLVIENKSSRESLKQALGSAIKIDNTLSNEIDEFYKERNNLRDIDASLKSELFNVNEFKQLMKKNIVEFRSSESLIKQLQNLVESLNDSQRNYLNERISLNNFIEVISKYPEVNLLIRQKDTMFNSLTIKLKPFDDDENVIVFLNTLDSLSNHVNNYLQYDPIILDTIRTKSAQINESKNNEFSDLLNKFISTIEQIRSISGDFVIDYNKIVGSFDFSKCEGNNSYKAKEIDNLKIKFQQNNEKLESLVVKLFEHVKNNYVASESLKYLAFQYSSPTVQQIQINSVVHTAEQNTVSSFKLPSESDLINAMAMFLAKRAQQEAMIWFIDRLKEDMHNPLLFDAFPNTFNLLRESESFNQPSFGQKWRYALSKDLVNVPLALLQSHWVRNMWVSKDQKDQIDEAVEMIKVGHEIFKLLQSQYNYRDILRYIYINKSQILNAESKGSNDIVTRFDFLYMVINELYNVDIQDDIPVYRLLSYEEISTLSIHQWEIFLELVRIKYDTELYNFIKKYVNNVNNTESFNKLGSLLLTLSQFDKIRNSTNENSENNSATNLWGNLLRVVEQLDTHKVGSAGDNTKKAIDYFKSGIRIYDYIYQNKFDLVVKETLDLLTKTLIVANTGDSITFKINIKEKQQTKNNRTKDSTIYPSFFEKFEFDKILKNEIKISYSLRDSVLVVNESKPVKISKLKDKLDLLNYIHPNKKDNNELWDMIRSGILKDADIHPIIFAFIKDKYKSDNDSYFTNISYYALQNIKMVVDLINYKNSSEPIPIQNIANTIESLAQEKQLFNKYAKQLVKTTSFFSDMFYATDAKAMAAVIDRHALPPTSYTLKRKVPFSITFNGYVGVYGGIQRIYSTHSEFKLNNRDLTGVYGLTAPVGFTFSRADGGVFLQLIDVGNLVGHYLWRVNPDDARPNVTFKEVISPGISFMHYIKRSPFALFAGMKGILLDEKIVVEKNNRDEVISEKNYNTAILDMIQFNVGIKIDIPIFNIYTKRY